MWNSQVPFVVTEQHLKSTLSHKVGTITQSPTLVQSPGLWLWPAALPGAPAAPPGPWEPSGGLPPGAPPPPRSRPPAVSRPSRAETAGDGEGEVGGYRGTEEVTGEDVGRRGGSRRGRSKTGRGQRRAAWQVCGFVREQLRSTYTRLRQQKDDREREVRGRSADRVGLGLGQEAWRWD